MRSERSLCAKQSDVNSRKDGIDKNDIPMIPRRALTCLKLNRSTRALRNVYRNGKTQCRSGSTANAPASPSSTPHSLAAPLASITNELDKLAPHFNVSADSIEIIQSPSDFYETLKSKIRKAKRRIYLSTLYVGKTEYELVCNFLFTMVPLLTRTDRRDPRRSQGKFSLDRLSAH